MTRFRWIHPPFHSLHPTFGSLLLPQGAVSGPCCSQWGWSPLLRSTGSGGTCIPPGISAFLLQAFTAHYRNLIHLQPTDNPPRMQISERLTTDGPNCCPWSKATRLDNAQHPRYTHTLLTVRQALVEHIRTHKTGYAGRQTAARRRSKDARAASLPTVGRGGAEAPPSVAPLCGSTP